MAKARFGLWAALGMIPVLGLYQPLMADEKSGPFPAIIDSIEIVNENVFDTDEKRYDNFLFRLANNLHCVTRPSIISRELLLETGDPYDTSLVHESERNLRSLPYLFKTEISMEKGEDGKNIMVVNTSDKWSTTVRASFHRSGRKDDFQFGFEENNLFGYGIFMTHDYFVLEDDRNYYQFEIIERRLLGHELYLDFFYSDNPRTGILTLIAGRPFYSLTQRFSLLLTASRVNERTDYYLNEILVARDKLKGHTFDIAGQYRIGPDKYKLYFMADYRFRDNDWLGRQSEPGFEYLEDDHQAILPPKGEDSVYNFVQVGVRFRQFNYGKYFRLNRFGKPEDINRGFDCRLLLGRAFSRSQDNYYLATFQPQYSAGNKRLLAIGGLSRQTWFRSNETLRYNINYYFKSYWLYNAYHTLAVNFIYQYDKLGNSSLRFYLDEDNGLRGFPAYYMSGEKRAIINIENRIFSNIEILSVGLGGVFFADIGNIWNRDRKFSIANSRGAFGLGLRLGVTRSTQAEIIRLDAAYAPSLNNWQISFGTGQYF